MDNENIAPEMADTSFAEVSTRKKCIIYVLIISGPIAAGLVVGEILKDSTLGLGVMWLVAGLLLLTLIAFRWSWLKKYMPGVMNKVRVSGERKARKSYSVLPAFFTVFGIVFVVWGVI